MRVLVCGSTGCVGGAVVHALRSRGHRVVEGARGLADTQATLPIDFAQARAPQEWAEALRSRRIDAVVNAVGILMPSRGQSFDRVHARGPIELFAGAVQAGVRRVVQVSALGVDGAARSLALPYLASKLRADDALAALPLEWLVLRPSLVHGPGSRSAALFATLASLPVIGLPGRGLQPVQPLHVYELAEAIVRQLERDDGWCRVREIAGPAPVTYRAMLAEYRRALGLGPALWLPLPAALMRGAAWAAEALPQKVFCRATLALLERGNVAPANAAAELLGRTPTDLARGLAITAPAPLIDLRVSLSPATSLVLRMSLAFMWLYTALISALWPQRSGVLHLLARCGFEGDAGLAMLIASCTLNTALGLTLLACPTPRVYALQCAAVLGYTVTAALNMPELTLDHCGPLVKNLPVLALLWLLWSASPQPSRAPGAPAARSVARSGLLHTRRHDAGLAPTRGR